MLHTTIVRSLFVGAVLLALVSCIYDDPDGGYQTADGSLDLEALKETEIQYLRGQVAAYKNALSLFSKEYNLMLTNKNEL